MINEAHQSKQDLYYNRERPSITDLVEPGKHTILDLGCGAGVVGRKLMSLGKASRVIGVELFPEAAAEASRHYETVHQGDVEQMDFRFPCEFDYAICGDILEHLRDPYSVVRKIHGWLKPGGMIICSVPNIRHWRVIVDLLFFGNWTYVDAGIMDRTHLRFFTRRSSHQMLKDAGFAVLKTNLLISGRKYRLLNRVTFNLLSDLLGSQLVVLGVKGRQAP